MKQLYILLVFCLSYSCYSQEPFVTTWDVGFPNFWSYEIYINTVDDLEYNYTIDFGDGSVQTNVTGDVSHTYDTAGIHIVTITGQFPAIRFQGNGAPEDSELKIKSIEQWGDIEWQTMAYAFNGCDNLVLNAVDAPNLSQVTDMSYMFHGADKINGPVNHWDVSNVINMEALFYAAHDFNNPLDQWDVSNVTNMVLMLGYCDFDQPINNWDVSNVTDMRSMFGNNIHFNQPLNDWDVSNVTDMTAMFLNAESFNQPLDNWDVSSVTTMYFMFSGALAFDQPIDTWDVSSVTDMEAMLSNTESFNQPLNSWNVSNVTTMSSMFSESLAFNQSLANWDTGNVTAMEYMFYNAESFNQPISYWNISNVTAMSSMFFYASSFNQSLENWDFSPAVEIDGLLHWAGLDVENYDALLARFQELGYEDKSLGANTLLYCNTEAHDYLVNILDWSISGDMVSEDCNLNTNQPSFSDELVIYPVPADKELFIEASSPIQVIEIFDISGKKIYFTVNENGHTDISTLAAGNYFLKIYSKDESVIKRFIKK